MAAVECRFLSLADAEADEVVVVIDVLRAFTTVPWLDHRGVARVLAVDTPERATSLRDGHLPGALLAGEVGGRPLPGFDLGNSPTEVATTDLPLAGGTVIHRTSAGTQGLVRCAGAGALFAASFVNAAATARAVQALTPRRVSFVITGASLGRDGDEDLAAAELIAALLRGSAPDPVPFLARVAPSDAGRNFTDDGPDWAPASDLAAACDLDRFGTVLRADAADVPVEVGATPVIELTALAG
jgi:2-phosphosulfolactate phosphatase